MARTWTYEEDLAVFHLKLKYGPSLTHEHPGVIALASAMKGSSAASVWLRKRNFDCSETPEPGLRNAARQTVEIWNRYWEDPAGVAGEAERAYAALTA